MSKRRRAKPGEAIGWLLAHVGYDGPERLPWPFFVDTSGYGRVKYDGRMRWAHSAMCELVNGPCPPGHESAHNCGHGKFGCVHPKHLEWKTPSENQYDRRRHGTHGKRKGVRYHLTPAQVAEIRSLRGKVPQRELAKRYDVSWQTIGNVQRFETWKTGEYAGGRPRANASLLSIS